MKILKILFSFVVILHGAFGQGSYPATVTTPTVETGQGKEARLACVIPSNSTTSSIRFCVWERLQQRSTAHAFIINFNEINSQPGLYSGVSGYSYSGEGFPEGECGVKISFVKNEDLAKWQCTLITDDKIFRGYVDLVKKPEPTTTTTTTTTTTKRPVAPVFGISAIANSRTAIDDFGGDGRARPIITSYNDARSIIQPEIIVQSTGADGSPQLIQEVKVESAGLEIKPRRGGKLIVFE